MSRIGKNPVPLPAGVKAALTGRTLAVQGPKGTAELAIHPLISVRVDEAGRRITVAPDDPRGRNPKEARLQRSMWGTTRKLIANMVHGVTEGYTREVQVVGVGYAARIDGKNLVLRCGYSHEIVVPIPDGITVDPPKPDSLMVSGVGQTPCTTLTFHGVDKQQVGLFAATVRQKRPPEPYKGKGIRYMGEEVKRKAGKALAAGTG